MIWLEEKRIIDQECIINHKLVNKINIIMKCILWLYAWINEVLLVPLILMPVYTLNRT